MKRVIALAFTAVLSFTALSCSDDDNDKTNDTIIESAQLPQAARDFIATHFPDVTYTRVEKESRPDDDGSIYDVHLSNGFEIDFDVDGNWTDIDGNKQAIPTAIIPVPITNYVTANYAGTTVNTIEIESYGYDVELSNGIDLVFDVSGGFVRIDK